MKKHRNAFLKNLFSRQEWMRRLLRMPLSDVPANQRGMVLIQIDGLSRAHFVKAIEQSYVPFLWRLMQKQNYRAWPMYSGVPSVTPSVQGEIFYGVRQCTPAFQFWDRDKSKKYTMFEEKCATDIEQKMEAEGGEPLLRDGSSYGNIFSGGACESHLCATTATWKTFVNGFNPYPIVLSLIFYPLTIVRAAALVIAELFLALVDVFKGVLKGYDFVMEALFILTRLFVSIFMREIITAHAKIDIHRGLPIIHVNLFAFDEQAHRRGPSSRFAFWSLSGIDGAIKRLWRAAQTSGAREYDVWIYSDHGQEDVTPYHFLTGRNIKTAITEIYENFLRDEIFTSAAAQEEKVEEEKKEVVITAMGPVAHVYFPRPLTAKEKEGLAGEIAKSGRVPLVIYPRENGEVTCWTPSGTYELPAGITGILGADHKFAPEIASDMVDLCKHEHRGDLMLMGWAEGSPAVSFAHEHGAHAGIGPLETEAFALLPDFSPLPSRVKKFMRPADLREAALTRMNRLPKNRSSALLSQAA